MAKAPPQKSSAGLALLRSMQPGDGPFPGAAGVGPVGRLHGRYARVTWGGVATLQCFDWELEFIQEFADATAHGDFWRVRLPLTQDWRARVRGYMTFATAANLTYLSTAAGSAATNLNADPAAYTLTCFSGPGGSALTIFTGSGYAERGRVLAPMAMVTQELEIVSAQMPAGFQPGGAGNFFF